MSLSEAIAAGYHARRPWWQRFGEAVAGRAPDTLRGRWTIEARAAVALACVALVGAVVGGWYYWQSQSTVIALPDGSGARDGSVDLPAVGSGLAGAAVTAGLGTSGTAQAVQPLGAAGALGAPGAAGAAGAIPVADPTLPAAPHRLAAGGPGAGLGPSGLPAALAGPSSPNALIIDVEGKVAHPGIVTLPLGSRVFEALNAAGGTTAGADATGLDLARPLVDGEQLRIGLPGAPTPPSGVANPANPANPAPAARGGHKTKPAQPVNLNTATLEQLETIPSVGPAMAQRILDWRAEHSRFESVDQLREVKGIGDKKFATMQDSVTV